MKEIVRMIVVLSLISFASGGLLAALREGTQERIDQQVLEFVKGPAIRTVFQGAGNDPIANRFQIKDGGEMRSFFVGVIGGEPRGVAFETSGRGYKAEVGLMVAIDVKDDRVIAVDVTTHSETPGLGSKAKTDPKFSGQFKGLPVTKPVKVNQDGGSINAISGATITSRAVTGAASSAFTVYERLKPEILAKMKELKY